MTEVNTKTFLFDHFLGIATNNGRSTVLADLYKAHPCMIRVINGIVRHVNKKYGNPAHNRPLFYDKFHHATLYDVISIDKNEFIKERAIGKRSLEALDIIIDKINEFVNNGGCLND